MPATRRRSTTKLLRLFPEELAQITARAEACGRTAARFIRERALGAVPKARHHVVSDRLLRTLARIGGNLERAARRAHTGGDAALAEHITAALDHHRALAAQVVSLTVRNGSRRAHSDASPQPRSAPIHTQASAGKRGRAEPSSDQLPIDFDRAGPPAPKAYDECKPTRLGEHVNRTRKQGSGNR